MQIGNKRKSSLFILPLLLVVLLSSALAVSAAAPQKVAILPFEVLAAKDMAYLNEGVRVMLGSRLAAGAGVTVIDRGVVNKALGGNGVGLTPEKIMALGKKLGADYLVVGNLTAMGGVSLDAKVHSMADGGVQNFFATAASEGEVIKAVDKLAWDVAAKVFGVAPPASSAPAVSAAKAQSPYQSMHPDRAFLGATGGGSSLVRAGATTGPGGFTKSRNFKMGLQAMEMADVDGDGQMEVILADFHKVKILRREDGRLTEIGIVKSSPRYRIHGVTVADINDNGRAEIYISAADSAQPNSFVVEWDGKKFATIVKDARWYLRAVSLPGEGTVVMGQQGGLSSPIRPGIYRLNYNDSNFSKGESFSVPNDVNLFDFSVGDLDGDGGSEVVSINQQNRLRVSSVGGRLIWESDDYYGGTTRYIGGSPDFENTSTIEDPNKAKRIYIPSRIIIADVNMDGINEVVVNKNLASASRVFEKWKSYPTGELHALTWNGLGLAELWHTRKIDGYVPDYVFKAEPEQKKAELLVGVVLGSGAMELISDQRSTVLTYPVQMDFAEDK
ncbi:MAG: VCBS repeat-containing protein [Desulfobulbaceae bacterium]|nr:VCBS repeat-containing protein [Desulfobulbaceae bacterium]